RKLVVLGATGSVGVSTLDVAARHPDRFEILALTAHRRIDLLFEQCRQFTPRYAVAADPDQAEMLRARARAAGLSTEILAGAEGLVRVASLPEADIVMAAIVGIAGLAPTLAAAAAGKRVLLANKEALVTAGALFMETVAQGGASLVPIDSEHNAIFQALPPRFAGDLGAVGVRRILLTASGGPFRDWPAERMATVTPDQACAHPNWVMGRKISVDSATMMNKGLEVIEARWLFNADPSQIQVVIHPQSVIHSLVEYVDGSVLAQLGNPDMRTPIACALAHPDRVAAGVESLNLAQIGSLTFQEPDHTRFPCLGLAYAALRAGGAAPVILNAANEVAVAEFLAGRLRFDRIARLIEAMLERVAAQDVTSLSGVLAADRATREAAQEWLARQGLRVVENRA
ncbi:MAG: 1-deoxy-D-xylulose-5-phosphate reductoisomerase, partial [Burkholderiales bacterium]